MKPTPNRISQASLAALALSFLALGLLAFARSAYASPAPTPRLDHQGRPYETEERIAAHYE